MSNQKNKLPVLITPEASEDLQAVYQYSVENWGTEKADDYLYAIYKTIYLLSENDKAGKEAESFNGCRYFPAKKHVIFYRSNHGNLEILRLFHESSDYKINLQH